MGDVGRDMREAVHGLLTRAQDAGAIRADLQMPELMALLTATCLAAEHSRWDTDLRTRTLAIVFDGVRPSIRSPRRHQLGSIRPARSGITGRPVIVAA